MTAVSDESEYNLVAYPGAKLSVALSRDAVAVPEIRLFGNRRGVLSLANVMLWLLARSSEREVLSLALLPFVKCEGPISLSLRITEQDSTPERCGRVRALDGNAQFEWQLPEDDLQHVALSLHHMACFWEHEYELYPLSDDEVVDARVHARLIER